MDQKQSNTTGITTILYIYTSTKKNCDIWQRRHFSLFVTTVLLSKLVDEALNRGIAQTPQGTLTNRQTHTHAHLLSQPHV